MRKFILVCFLALAFGCDALSASKEFKSQEPRRLNTTEALGQIELKFDHRSSSQSFSRLIYRWLAEPDFNWRDAIAFSMIEGDTSGKFDFSASVKVPIKKIAELDLTYNYSSQINAEFNTKGDYCGMYTLNYFENPKTTMLFGAQNVSVTISD